MTNEKLTEKIVRQNFEKYKKGKIHIHEQLSSNSRINKLLSSASKSGSGKGFPDFIIEFEEYPDFLIVIECKASPHKHCSPGLDKFKDYAVDGALLYASHLNKDYDVLAIGVSGTNKKNLKVSHFLKLKNQPSPVKMFNGQLLPTEDYVKGYISDPHKQKQDFDSLIQFIHELNDKLHQNSVSVNNRAIFISVIMIALERQSFKNAYRSEKNSKSVAQLVVKAGLDQLREAGIKGDRLQALKSVFELLTVEKDLLENNNELIEIIKDIDEKINGYIKNNQYRDVLGSLYTEFLKYANSDKGLGIVLTPPHIANFFTELAELNKKSVVYDNCAGTGGFLIHAMGSMIDDAGGHEKTIKHIKKSQLYGTELSSEIYPLSVCNMFIHQDGKSNIRHANCFNDQNIQFIKKKKPTVGFLNPPYKSDKKTDTEELKFVLNNLECLQQNGVCVAIIPMQSALSTSKKITLLKEKIMEEHTLEAVFSMPDELFFNSGVGVVTCVMIFTAHKKHPNDKEVYLGYYKDDGFAKRKLTGRSDVYHKWNGIKGKWLKHYVNKDEIPGLSIKRTLKPKDEWCAEAYMETDYTKISPDLFVNTLHQYSSYLFSNKMVEYVSSESVTKTKKVIDMSNWNTFALLDLFMITGSKTTLSRDLNIATSHNGFPYVATQATNNGVKGFYDTATEDGNVLTIDSAVIGYCAYQDRKFAASDHVEKLMPKFSMNKYIAMFLVTVINMEQYRYNYGRKCSQTRLKSTNLKLPAASDGNPDWSFMEDFIKSLPYSTNL